MTRILALLVLLLAQACATNLAPAETAAPAEPYKLAPGDELTITVFGEDDISGAYLIDGAGNVTFPLIGMINAAGSSPADFRNRLASSLSEGYLLAPSITVTVANPRPIYVLGEVRQPGEYEYSEAMTVLKAVAKAGGFTYRANKSRFFVLRYGEAEEHKYILTPGATVAPGDTIRIGERYF